MTDTHKDNSDTAKTLDFREHVRKRPVMYIGNNRVVGLFHGLVIDCIDLCKSDKITFEIIISGDNDFSMSLSSSHDLSPIIDKFNDTYRPSQNYYSDILKAISKTFTANSPDKNHFAFNFSLDEAVLPPYIDYLKLSEEILRIALLNRQCEIITVDKRRKYVTQNYYHFPEGTSYLFDRATKEVLGKPEFKLTFDGKVNTNKYQIGIAYRSDWYPAPNVISFANDVPTIYGGSLVDGVLAGFMNACKIYVKENNMTNHKVVRKKFTNGLVLVCAVRGGDFKFGGSFKETLEDDNVKRQAKKITQKLALDLFKNDKQTADKFLWRFDDTQLGAKIM